MSTRERLYHQDDALLLSECSGGMPRFFTPSHPRAVRSLFDAEAERYVVEEMGYQMRPWQRAVLVRAFEVDEDGELCWHIVIVSVGRQVGKTFIIRMLVNLRQRLFAHHEPQSILHIARVREAARSVIVNEQFKRWAEGRGITVRSSNGQEQWKWPDDSTWDLSSLDGAYGRSAGLVMLDESWDITRRAYYEGVQPTTAARPHAQTWIFSAAHREASELTPLMIQRARDGRDGYMLADWGALDGEDLGDPEVWRTMGPHWDKPRALAVSEAAGEDAFAEQWANRWPDVLKRGKKAVVFPAWPEAPKVKTSEPPQGVLVAIDEARDSSVVGVGIYDRKTRSFWYREVGTLHRALELALTWDPSEIAVGLTLKTPAEVLGFGYAVGVGARETRSGTPLLRHAIDNRRVAHEHSPAIDEMFKGAAIRETDAGTTLAPTLSDASVLAPKLLAWLLVRERMQGDEDQTAIW